jgi:hypothetical protein
MNKKQIENDSINNEFQKISEKSFDFWNNPKDEDMNKKIYSQVMD